MKTSGIETATLFVDDVAVSKEFYGRTFGLDVVYEDDESVVFQIGSVLVNLLAMSAAGELVAPATPTKAPAVRSLLTVIVADVDAEVAALRSRGVAFANGPITRPWGRRTAAFADPDGHMWELAQKLS